MLWRDGKISHGEPSLDPSLTGWGAFSTVGCDFGRPLLWDRHRARLTESLAHLGAGADIPIPDESSLRELIVGSGLLVPARLRVVGSRVGLERWVVEASVAQCGPVGPTVPPSHLLVERWSSAPPLIGHKTLARLPWDLARSNARYRGADDALLVDSTGRVLETPIANVWIVCGCELRTPPAPTSCLPGVMRGWLVERAADVGFEVSDAGFTVADLEDADEVWVSNAVAGVRRVGRVNDRVWQRWPAFDRLKRLGVPAPGWRAQS